jgi:hypothetical protein
MKKRNLKKLPRPVKEPRIPAGFEFTEDEEELFVQGPGRFWVLLNKETLALQSCSQRTLGTVSGDAWIAGAKVAAVSWQQHGEYLLYRKKLEELLPERREVCPLCCNRGWVVKPGSGVLDRCDCKLGTRDCESRGDCGAPA